MAEPLPRLQPRHDPTDGPAALRVVHDAFDLGGKKKTPKKGRRKKK